jgi:hypothetical protein
MTNTCILATIVCIAILVGVAFGSDNTITQGRYRLSFDIGLNQSDEIIMIDDPVTGTWPDGGIYVKYTISVSTFNLSRTNYTKSTRTTDELINAMDESDCSVAIITITESSSPLIVDLSKDSFSEVKCGSVTKMYRNTTRVIDRAAGSINMIMFDSDTTWVQAAYNPRFNQYVVVNIVSTFPWDTNTNQLLKTIRVDKIE